MENGEIQFNKRRDTGTIITDTFSFLRQELKSLSGLILIYVFPFIILYSYGQVAVMMKLSIAVDLSDPEQLIQNFWPVYLNLLLISLFGIFVQSLYIGAYYTYIETYIKKGKGNFRLTDFSHYLFSNTLSILGTSLIILIIVILGLFLFIVPGIYFANSLSLAIFVVLIEKKGIGNALLKSIQLVKIRWWDTFFLNLTGIVLVLAVGIIFSIPAYLAGFSPSVFSVKGDTQTEFPQWYWILTGINAVISSLFHIILYTFYIFQYYNLSKIAGSPEDTSGRQLTR